MIEIRNKKTGVPVGSISEDQLQFLVDQLEEESADDRDYYINRDTLELFANRGVDEGLLNLLREALGDQQDMEIEWTRQ